MIKFIVLFLFLLRPSYSITNSNKFTLTYYREIYNLSYHYIKRGIFNNEKLDKDKVFKVLDMIHPSIFIQDEELESFYDIDSYLNYPLGVRLFFNKKIGLAEKKLEQVKKDNPQYTEANYLLGIIHLNRGNYSLAEQKFKTCSIYSSKKKKYKNSGEKFFKIFRNRCIQMAARLNFSKGEFKKSLALMNLVEKTDYIWPRFLMDRAWSYYWLNEKERSLGTILTYNSPILQRYFVPEASYLTALLYFEKCHYEKADNLYNDFMKNTWKFKKYYDHLSVKSLYKMMLSNDLPKKIKDRNIYFFLKGYKKDIKYLSFLKSIKQVNEEIQKVSKSSTKADVKEIMRVLIGHKNIIQEDFMEFIKAIIQDYNIQLLKMKNAFVKLHLAISKMKRVSSKIEVGKNEKKNDLDDISDTDDKFIWNFLGGFWADELGDYAVFIGDRCAS